MSPTPPSSAPSAVGIDGAGILALVDALETTPGVEPHSIAIARRGQVVATGAWAPYRLDRVQLLYSLSKSNTATAIAVLHSDGLIGMDDRLLSRLPTAGVTIDPRWDAVTIEHCLTMTVGHSEDAWGEVMSRAYDDPARPTSFLAATLANGPDRPPGTLFTYNQVATYLLSRVVAHVAGRPLLELLRERVYDPLGIGEALWHRCPEGFELGFSGLHLAPQDVSTMTQLWLRRGAAPDGTQLVDPAWFDAAVRPFLPVAPDSTSDWEQGYGYSFWKSRHGHRGDGAFGQYGVFLPANDLAVAITSEVDDMQVVLDLLWEHLLPAVDRSPATGDVDAAVASRLTALTHAPIGSSEPAPVAAIDAAVGSGGRVHLSLPGDYSRLRVVPDPAGDGWALTFVVAGDDLTIPAGDGAWVDGELVSGPARLPTAASAGWVDGRFRAVVRFAETPHSVHVDAGPSGPAAVTWRLAPLGGPDPRWLAVRSSAG